MKKIQFITIFLLINVLSHVEIKIIKEHLQEKQEDSRSSPQPTWWRLLHSAILAGNKVRSEKGRRKDHCSLPACNRLAWGIRRLEMDARYWESLRCWHYGATRARRGRLLGAHFCVWKMGPCWNPGPCSPSRNGLQVLSKISWRTTIFNPKSVRFFARMAYRTRECPSSRHPLHHRPWWDELESLPGGRLEVGQDGGTIRRLLAVQK